MEPTRPNDDCSKVLDTAINQLARESASPNSADSEVVLSSLRRLLSPVVCRRLGIYDWPEDFLLSVVIPVFNEAATVATLIQQVREVGVPCELIVVDDASTDETEKILAEIPDQTKLTILRHETNQGKGAAIRTGLAKIRGTVAVIQDADLEYSPIDFLFLLLPILEDRADVVYGSRFSSNDRPVARYWHQTGNRVVTWLSNMFTNLKLSDVETCYKLMRRELVEQVLPSLRENGFGIELEITAKLARIKGVRFYELPISYSPRGYAEGKKIGWRDGFWALWCVFRYSFRY
ncbi:MAG: glycosyltransferase family 2 protein [Pirellulaceae bacterium]|nr:glycosyltransferase family 2 protein [Pirellulaceae bacterium]